MKTNSLNLCIFASIVMMLGGCSSKQITVCNKRIGVDSEVLVCRRPKSEDWENICRLKRLRNLEIVSDEEICLGRLKCVNDLVSLTVTSPAVVDVGSVEKMKTISTLTLSRFAESEIDVEAMEGLETLWLPSSFKLAKIHGLDKNNNIVQIDISNSNISEMNFSLKNSIKSLNLSRCKKIKDFHFLERLKNIEALDMTSTSFANLGLLAEMDNLKYLNISYTKVKDNVKILEGLKSLEQLYMDYSEFYSKDDDVRGNLCNGKGYCKIPHPIDSIR